MTEPESQDRPYVPSPVAGFAGLILTVGIVIIAVLDSFANDYDARATIAILAVLVGGIFGFDYRSGRWRGEPRVTLKKDPPEVEQ